jgi:hypothetical protein
MAGLPPEASASLTYGPVSEPVARAETLVAHARGKRAEATQRLDAATQAHESAVRERSQIEGWLRSSRADRQARRRDARDRAELLVARGLAETDSRPATRPGLMFFDAGFCMVSDPVSIVAALLEAAITLSRADLGNVQLCEPGGGPLRIAAQHGFGSEFLNFFDVVDDQRSACGLALAQHRTVQVDDVAASHVFDGGSARDVVLGAGVRAVRSIPLVDGHDGLLGVMSVHYGRPHRPDPVEQNILAALAAAAARRLVVTA